MDLKAAAKVDLHRHLEGAIRLQTLIDLYRDAGHPLSTSTPVELSAQAQVLEPMSSLEAVLSRFGLAQAAFFDEAAAERVAFEAVEDLAADNVRLAELRFSPGFLCEPHGLDWDAAMTAIARGVERGSREHDVAVGLIAIASRNYGIGSAERTAEFALRHRDGATWADYRARGPAQPDGRPFQRSHNVEERLPQVGPIRAVGPKLEYPPIRQRASLKRLHTSPTQ